MNGELITTAYTYHDGRVAINNAFSAQSSFNIFSASTIYSGSTDLSQIFMTTGNTAAVHAFQALTDGAIVLWDYTISPNATLNLGGNRTLSISGMTDGCFGTILVTQGGSGGNTLALPTISKVVNGGGGSVLLSSNIGDEDILSFVYASGKFYWNAGFNYS